MPHANSLGLTWEGKNDGEVGGADDGRKPAIAPVQEGQHEACTSSNKMMGLTAV